MLITKDQKVAGIKATEARAILRAIGADALSADAVEHEAGVLYARTYSLLCQLENEGLVCRLPPDAPFAGSRISTKEDGPNVTLWQTTVAGNALAKARVGKPIPRAKAQRLLDEFLARVVEINADADMTYRVERVELFGSFADPDRGDVGDVDLVVTWTQHVLGDEYVERALAAAEASGRRFSTYMEKLMHLHNEFMRRLWGGKKTPLLDLQMYTPEERRQFPDSMVTTVLYQREG